METIRIYLDNLFLSLPDNEETRRVKEELYAMMEDKYQELKAGGKTENEAIGAVITEFGNLEELKEDLHLSSDSEASFGQDGKEHLRYVSADEAEQYIQAYKKSAFQTALGTMLCIFSPTFLIYLAGLSEYPSEFLPITLSENMAALFGLLFLFGCVATAVGLFIFQGIHSSERNYLKQEEFRLDYSTSTYIKELYGQFRTGYAVQITLGVIFCIISPLPLICTALITEENDMALIIGVCLLLFLVGAGVFLLVQTGMQAEAYKVLLQQEEYTPEKKRRNNSSVWKAISDSYWTIITAVYFIWSFASGDWHITWIIWVLGGIFEGLLKNIFRAMNK